MKADELVKLIEKAGWKLERMGAGSARIYRNPKFNYPISVHYHRGAEIKTGMANKILKQAGVK